MASGKVRVEEKWTLPFSAAPAQIAAACLCGLEFTQRIGTEAILKCSFNKISQPHANMFPFYWAAKEDYPPSWENLLLLFFIHILNVFTWHLKFSHPPQINKVNPSVLLQLLPSPPLFESAEEIPILSLLYGRCRTPLAACTPAIGWSHRQLHGWLVSSLSKVASLFSEKSFPLDPFLILGNWHTSLLFKS